MECLHSCSCFQSHSTGYSESWHAWRPRQRRIPGLIDACSSADLPSRQISGGAKLSCDSWVMRLLPPLLLKRNPRPIPHRVQKAETRYSTLWGQLYAIELVAFACPVTALASAVAMYEILYGLVLLRHHGEYLRWIYH